MPYQLCIANKNYSSWSLRPWLLMRELAIPFDEIVTPFSLKSNREGFRRFSPTGKAPCLIDNDIVVWDSLAITEYLAESYPTVWPRSPKARAWARCASAEMHSGFVEIRNRCPMNVSVRARLKERQPSLEKELTRLVDLWEQGLKAFGGPFLAGDTFTAVDAFFAPVVFRAQTYDFKLSSLTQNYVQRMLNLSSMQQWQQEALNEIWREEEHENETRLNNEIIDDLRMP